MNTKQVITEETFISLIENLFSSKVFAHTFEIAYLEVGLALTERGVWSDQYGDRKHRREVFTASGPSVRRDDRRHEA